MGVCGGSKEEKEAAKDFNKYDKDNSKTMDEAELREFVVAHRHGQLWETIHLNLSIEAERAKDIATFVSFSLAGGKKGGTITMAQFIEFKKNWVDDHQGNQKFMLHTVFSSQDTGTTCCCCLLRGTPIFSALLSLLRSELCCCGSSRTALLQGRLTSLSRRHALFWCA